MVLNGSPSIPWSGWITTSYKKHGALLARVNQSPHGIWAFDEMRVDCADVRKVRDWWNIMTTAQKTGIWRTMQENVECPPVLISKIGLKIWNVFESWAMPRRQSSLYVLLCYLLPSKEELKNADA